MGNCELYFEIAILQHKETLLFDKLMVYSSLKRNIVNDVSKGNLFISMSFPRRLLMESS